MLAGPVDTRARLASTYPTVEAVPGLDVVHRASGFTGVVLRVARDGMLEVRGRTGLDKVFAMRPGAFAVGGRPVTLVRPVPAAVSGRGATGGVGPRTASGSRAVPGARARVARSSRILVEGIHDAELVEKVWGDDLRIEGVVVERLDGLDNLAHLLRVLDPGPNRRVGVLVDHLVPGSKESRLVEQVSHPDVLVTGTPYVDVWQAVRPAVVGIEVWPAVPKGSAWKAGICAALGVSDPATLWRRILSSVRSYADLEPALVGSVEQLIDFVTVPSAR